MTSVSAVVAWTPGELDDWAWISARLAARGTWFSVRTGLTMLRYLHVVRRAFPWPLRALIILGMIQNPFLPIDEVAAVIAVAWLWLCYRPLVHAIRYAARTDVRDPR